MLHCCRKAVFAQLLSRLQLLLPQSSSLLDGRYIPRQWALPAQADELSQHVASASKAAKKPPVYISKPDNGSQGDGITLTTDPSKPSWDATKERVVQEYIGKPLLLDNLKFDLRLYVLIVFEGGAGMRAFLCREGLARFAVDAYTEPSKQNLRNVHMHLTNYSLNKKADGFKHNDEADGGDDGSKRTVSSVFESLRAAGLVDDVDTLWGEISALVGRALAVISPVLASARSEQPCFKVMGFDVLLDSKCRPWLIEINDHPSLRIDLAYDEPGQYSMNGLNSIPSPVDEAIKVPMLEDALRVVAACSRLRATAREGDAGGAYGTSFFEVDADPNDAAALTLLQRLWKLFEQHTPAAARREVAERSMTPRPDNDTTLCGPGLRWKTPTGPFSAFLQSVGIVGPRGASGVAKAGTIARADIELIVLSTCGKGGAMDIFGFGEACVKVAQRIYSDQGAQVSPAELLMRMLNDHCGASG